ncbi:ABC transporter ATP-binding protein [Methylophilus sp. QUAN]|uniref:ABC transporter ATP-binding protein n=1 Tax=Methylophilus sp. QUAN TaxID=2781020 RepID=UPI00188FDAD2|nr:ABC transporter ATP-binding protein [Methylophilus sp. QUAN]MBF4990620.1 ABC transporter ATP-binding protein [Methylophilus sp. QUAN]
MNNIAIRVGNLSKCYHIYDRPQDRLKQLVIPKLRSLIGRNSGDYFREFWALNDVSFEVGSGETVGIIGRNGSGKSTLLQMICGTLEPTSGAVETRGRVAALLELGAGFNPEFTGRENVYMNATVLGLTQEEIQSRFEEIAAFADIGDFIEQPVKHYSSGMYARLAFAVAINVDPSILIVDEALAVGDEPFQRKCFARIEEIKRNGGTILFVSHSTSAIVELCDRAVLLYAGEMLFTGEPKKAIAWYQKLMNATHEQALQIRESIRQYNYQSVSSVEPLVVAQSDEGRSAVLSENIPPEALQESNSDESYDVSLVSKSMVAYEPNGAEISNFRIETIDGQIVNCLYGRARYKFCYDVTFTKNCEGVRFYTLIKTLTGVELGGGIYPADNLKGMNYSKGKKVTMFFEFYCGLNSGTYFINCGVGGNGGQSLHRIIDAMPFRVALNKNKTNSFGIIDFGYSPYVTDVFAKKGDLT